MSSCIFLFPLPSSLCLHALVLNVREGDAFLQKFNTFVSQKLAPVSLFDFWAFILALVLFQLFASSFEKSGLLLCRIEIWLSFLFPISLPQGAEPLLPIIMKRVDKRGMEAVEIKGRLEGLLCPQTFGARANLACCGIMDVTYIAGKLGDTMDSTPNRLVSCHS